MSAHPGFVNWELSRGAVIVGDNTTDWWEIITYANQHAYARPCFIVPGVYQATGTPMPIASGVTLIGNKDVVVVQSIAAGPVTNACINAPVIEGAATTATANSAVGAATVTVTADVANVGDYVAIWPQGVIGQRLRGHSYKVRSKAGLVYTLDHTLLAAVAIGDNVEKITPVENVRIIGNGMLICGTGQRYIELQSAQHCRVSGIRIDSTIAGGITAGEYGASFDTWGYDCEWSDISYRGDGTNSIGVVSETSDYVRFKDIFTYNCIIGVAVNDGFHNTFDNISADTGTTGLMVGSGSGGLGGCLGTKLTGVRAYKCTTQGVLITDGATDTYVDSCSSKACGTGGAGSGIGVSSTATGPTFISNSDFSGNTNGILTNNAGDVHVNNVDVSNCTTTGMVTSAGKQYIRGLTALNVQLQFNASIAKLRDSRVSGIVWVQGNANVAIDGCDIQSNASGFGYGVYVDTNGNGSISRSTLTFTGSPTAAVGSGATSTVQFGLGNDFTAFTTQVSLNAATTATVAQIGSTSKSLASGDVTLTHGEAAVNILRGTGNPGAGRNLIVPTISGMIWNASNEFSTAQTMTVKTAAGSGIAIAQNKNAWVRCDGTNVVRVTADT